MKTTRPTLVAAFAGFAIVLFGAGDALAQGKGKGKANEVYEIGPVIVTARPTRPSAVVELGKILPEIEIAKIRQPFLGKIEEALTGEPF
jgi:hypothetical protein